MSRTRGENRVRLAKARTGDDKHQLLQLLAAAAMVLAGGGQLRVQRVQQRASGRVRNSVVPGEREGGDERWAGRVREGRAERVQRAHAAARGAEGNHAQVANLQAGQRARDAGQRLQRQRAAAVLSHAARVVQRDDDL
jgi:hypothetical protein